MIDILLAFATWRVSYLLVKEAGPYEVFGRLRELVGLTNNEHGQRVAANELAKLFMCVYCMSVWVGLAFGLLRELAPSAIVYGLAYSGGALLIDALVSLRRG